MKASMIQTLFVNTEYYNEVTLDSGINGIIDLDVIIDWATFIEAIMGDNLESYDDEELLDCYGIEKSDLNVEIDSSTFQKYQDRIYFWVDNEVGGNAKAFNLVTRLSLFITDEMGNGSMHGVTTSQSTANGSAKSVYIENETAAKWLQQAFANEGIAIEIKFT
ncbi:hypothetical protein [Brumicola nitratireducens]|uniref:Uncharacterized protein n=1 Tax=Glaciecola nitratireducens (strain JCM 12485 / KCTC 12276 / FR1064) TaxID=1085623 RepID=G4QH87_GLANF|nr:hypothetical protein [Glaciecola nitratireducens]AEP29718.1 hypothetical protein GNIT_1601 [Glaciecola nitratireducens FR1064]